MTTDYTYTCSGCGAQLTTSFHSGINVRTEPQLKESVRDGSLFVAECPYCGRRNLLRGQLLYHDPDERLMIWLLPDGDPAEERLESIEQQLNGLEGYTLRRVPDAGTLIEKVNLHDAGLDDRVMEMCKYVTRMELAESRKDPSMADLPLKFFRMDGPDNQITLTYPRDGKMEGLEIGFNVYEDCRGILARNPAIQAGPGFARVDAAWIERFFR